MRLLDDVVLGIQAPRDEPLQEVVICSFLVVLAREIMMHLTMKWSPLSSYRGGYFYR